MNILLTGASGLLGGAFAQAADRRGHHVLGLVHSFTGPLPGLAKKRILDLGNEAAVTTAVLDFFPDAIVNCAAVSEPARCEADPALSQALNVALPAQLARLAHHLSARLLHLSSEQVFDGTTAEPHAVKTPVNPLNLYARQKVESERLVHSATAGSAITLRLPLLTGNSPGANRSLHERLFSDWAAGRAPRVYTDEIRQPCSAANAAELMVELLERNDARGLFHWAGADALTRHELACRIRTHFKLSESAAPLEPVSLAADPHTASRRPARLALDLKPLAGTVKTPIETFAAQLDQLVIPPAHRAWYFSV